MTERELITTDESSGNLNGAAGECFVVVFFFTEREAASVNRLGQNFYEDFDNALCDDPPLPVVALVVLPLSFGSGI